MRATTRLTERSVSSGSSGMSRTRPTACALRTVSAAAYATRGSLIASISLDSNWVISIIRINSKYYPDLNPESIADTVAKPSLRSYLGTRQGTAAAGVLQLADVGAEVRMRFELGIHRRAQLADDLLMARSCDPLQVVRELVGSGSRGRRQQLGARILLVVRHDDAQLLEHDWRIVAGRRPLKGSELRQQRLIFGQRHGLDFEDPATADGSATSPTQTSCSCSFSPGRMPLNTTAGGSIRSVAVAATARSFAGISRPLRLSWAKRRTHSAAMDASNSTIGTRPARVSILARRAAARFGPSAS